MENEKRLIDANELTDRLSHTTMVAYPNLFPGLLAAVEVVDDTPTVDAVEVVHGRWLSLFEYAEKIGADATKSEYPGAWVFCSKCGQQMRNISGWHYCPNCGADMRGEAE